MGDKSELYEQALVGKKVPVLTLDNKWYKLFKDLAELPRIQAVSYTPLTLPTIRLV